MRKLKETIRKIKKTDKSLAKNTQKRLDNLTKPVGSLGRLEELAKKIVEITKNENPSIKNKVIFTLAADHGVAEEKISAYPKEVTAQMVYNFIRGGAAINVLARHADAKVIVVDMGVACALKPHSKLIIKKVSCGTKNISKGPAMTREEAVKSIENGIDLFEEEFNKNHIDIIGTGDMGIGNTTPSSAIASVITGKPAEDTTGKGTGIDNKTLSKKIEAIKKAIRINKPNKKDGVNVLSKVGGFEIGGLAGIILAAASKRVPVIIDGFISGAAALIAYQLEPKIRDYIIAAHSSVEKGHKLILKYLDLTPLLDLQLRLGEGTGAALAMYLVEASIKILTKMATFESASISRRDNK